MKDGTGLGGDDMVKIEFVKNFMPDNTEVPFTHEELALSLFSGTNLRQHVREFVTYDEFYEIGSSIEVFKPG